MDFINYITQKLNHGELISALIVIAIFFTQKIIVARNLSVSNYKEIGTLLNVINRESRGSLLKIGTLNSKLLLNKYQGIPIFLYQNNIHILVI